MANSATPRRFLIATGTSLAAGGGIGVFLDLLGVPGGLAQHVVVSVCIALVCALVPQLVIAAAPSSKKGVMAYAAGAPVGALVGIVLLMAWLDPDSEGLRRIVVTVLVTTMIFGGIGATFFYLRTRKEQLEEELRAAELRRVEAERRGLEAQLKMLQAQIEPHFLFNTLANVTALIAQDPATARRLLEHLIVYLRSTLARTRSDGTTLADEVELLRAYLDICRIRMGERLRYAIDVPAPLLARPFPPMLLQPLVENAVTHGLEAKLSAGEVRISARNGDAHLCIQVVDNGVGFGGTAGGGTGVANVRARLAALYGNAARLVLEENRTGGVTATLEMPE